MLTIPVQHNHRIIIIFIKISFKYSGNNDITHKYCCWSVNVKCFILSQQIRLDIQHCRRHDHIAFQDYYTSWYNALITMRSGYISRFTLRNTAFYLIFLNSFIDVVISFRQSQTILIDLKKKKKRKSKEDYIRPKRFSVCISLVNC